MQNQVIQWGMSREKVGDGLRFALSDVEAVELAGFLRATSQPHLVMLGERLGHQLSEVHAKRAELFAVLPALNWVGGEVVE